MTVHFTDDTLRQSALLGPHAKESVISESTGGQSRDDAISASLAAIHDRGEGLYSQALVIIDGVVNFDDQAGYRTPITRSGSGGTTTFLDPHQYDQDTVEYNEAVLSQTDSEVACLQEAWDWLTLGLQGTPQSVDVVLVGNIGPCVPCQRRIKAFRDMVVSRFGARAAVEVVYDQDEASARDTMRGDIPTTYGYRDLPDSELADGTLVWSHTVT